MKKIIVDVRYSFEASNKSGKFNGGNNYTRYIVNLISRNKPKDFKLIVVCFDNQVKDVKTIFHSVQVLGCLSIVDYDFCEKDILFIPQVSDSVKYVNEISILRKKNPEIKICATIHDMRYREHIYDKYDGILKEGIRSSSVILYLGHKIRSVIVDYNFHKMSGCIDQLFTVSNYSMQRILRIFKNNDIKYYIQGTNKQIQIKKIINLKEKPYAIFLGAGRSEKNFIRTLLAYAHYTKQFDEKSLDLVVTGMSKKQLLKLKKNRVVDERVFDKIHFLDYINDDELIKYISNCRFLIFASKNEGFGLPALETLMCEKPMIVSNRSSIPEVAGAAAMYFNPFSVKSIYSSMLKMMSDSEWNYYLMRCKEKKNIILQQIELDERIFLHDLFEDKG